MSTPITVSIVEDNRGTRNTLSSLLRKSGGINCVSVHGTGEEALQGIPKHRPSVVLMDINLPGMSGIECVVRLKQMLPETEILMITAYEDPELIFDSLRAGASGYLLKTMPLTEVVDAIHQIIEGGVPMSASVARRLIGYFNEPPKSDPAVESLSTREREILDYLSQGFYDKDISDKLGITVGTVRNHLQRMYRKLHVRSRTEAVLKFLGK
jgi:DNA-binding NarL/FixJ family response regulator